MKALVEVKPTPEQLALFSRVNPGVEIIRGAAGSGKTTTALLKLRAAVGFYLNRRKRQLDRTNPIRILVLTFNRTLRGYVAELAKKQLNLDEEIELEVSTFSRWAMTKTGTKHVLTSDESREMILQRAADVKLPTDFLVDEVTYVLGKFEPQKLANYLSARRDGRGSVPRVDRALREQILRQVIMPYLEEKVQMDVQDYNDVATELMSRPARGYDVVVVDEAQDFSANEIRAVLSQMSEEYTATFVLDSAQRIYARSFVWSEVGVTVRPENSHRLSGNYRNTRQIARLAFQLMQGLHYDDNGAMPNFENAKKEGSKPLVLQGGYPAQVQYCIDYIKQNVDLDEESVAFLHLRGGGWFKYLRARLASSRLPFVEISQKAEWPTGEENIALSTLHSAKGLEFDHVFMIGMDNEIADVPDADYDNPEDERQVAQRRLIAMAVGRARKCVVIGYASEKPPAICRYFDEELVEAKLV